MWTFPTLDRDSTEAYSKQANIKNAYRKLAKHSTKPRSVLQRAWHLGEWEYEVMSDGLMLKGKGKGKGKYEARHETGRVRVNGRD
jgi:hypothetical protein